MVFQEFLVFWRPVRNVRSLPGAPICCSVGRPCHRLCKESFSWCARKFENHCCRRIIRILVNQAQWKGRRHGHQRPSLRTGGTLGSRRMKENLSGKVSRKNSTCRGVEYEVVFQFKDPRVPRSGWWLDCSCMDSKTLGWRSKPESHHWEAERLWWAVYTLSCRPGVGKLLYKGQTVSILGFAGHRLCHNCSTLPL